MHFETLYQEARWKRQHQHQLEQSQHQFIRQQSSMKKMNPQSNTILANKLQEKLIAFDDETLINIQTSIPILYSTGILQTIEDIESAKAKLQKGEFEHNRLKDEARFVYGLWKMIDEEEIETRQLKEIIYMLNDRSVGELKKSLGEMYGDQEAVSEFVETWKTLLESSKYYQSVDKRKDKISDRQIQKIMNYQPQLREKSFLSEFNEIKDCFLKSEVYPQKYTNDKTDLVAMSNVNFNSKNKENLFMDKDVEKSMIDRLYRADKYHMREVQKKVQEERRIKAELEECTFKPEINNDRLRSASNNKRSKSINGFQKSVQRMKVGVEKHRVQKELREHKPAGQNYYRLKQKKINPPKFLDRKKSEEPIQFIIQFDLGRHKVKVKVREHDTAESIASNLCKIYCLKQEYFDQICLILKKERVAFYEQKLM